MIIAGAATLVGVKNFTDVNIVNYLIYSVNMGIERNLLILTHGKHANLSLIILFENCFCHIICLMINHKNINIFAKNQLFFAKKRDCKTFETAPTGLRLKKCENLCNLCKNL